MTVERIKYAIKAALAHICYAVGILQVWQSIVLKRRAVILMYHRVLTPEEKTRTGSHPAIIVDRQTFAKQMAVVKRRFKVLSLEEFAHRVEHKVAFEDSSCLITFDDGWVDNFTNALPVLSSHSLPAVVFLPTDFIGGGRVFWHEELVHLLIMAAMRSRTEPSKKRSLRESIALCGLHEVFEVPHDNLRAKIIEVIGKHRKGLTPSVVEATILRLRAELGIKIGDGDGTDSFMDWRQVETMKTQGIKFGAHGASHRLLSEISIEEADKDIRICKKILEERFKSEITAFSYPRGYRSSEVVSLVKAAGYRLAFIANGGSVSSQDDPYTLRRINICQEGTESTPMFLARVVGLF